MSPGFGVGDARRTRRALRALRQRGSWRPSSSSRRSISLQVHRDHSPAFVNPHHRVRITDVPVGELRDVHEAVLMNAGVDESSKATMFVTASSSILR
jgi:hypothetical protein